jgi:hypothetical protein
MGIEQAYEVVHKLAMPIFLKSEKQAYSYWLQSARRVVRLTTSRADRKILVRSTDMVKHTIGVKRTITNSSIRELKYDMGAEFSRFPMLQCMERTKRDW